MSNNESGFIRIKHLWGRTYLVFDWDWTYFGLGFHISDTATTLLIGWLYLSIEY